MASNRSDLHSMAIAFLAIGIMIVVFGLQTQLNQIRELRKEIQALKAEVRSGQR